jgi:hypothetical protein
MPAKTLVSVAAAIALSIALTPVGLSAWFLSWSAWSVATPVAEVNRAAPVSDGCPIESRDGLSLYIASTRDGGPPNDIFAADRASKQDPFGTPVNLGEPVNGPFNDFCPTPVYGSYLFFVSERNDEGPTCAAGPGKGDIYLIRRNAASGWGQPQHLGCADDGTGPNTIGAEFSPSLVTTIEGTFLYFSSDVTGNQDIYRSKRGHDGRFGPPVAVSELNTEFDDRMPNVRSDGLEIVFSSLRLTDAAGTPRVGGFDVYVSKRSATWKKWSPPINIGPAVNTAGSETRATISWDGERLYFGRDGDIYRSTRTRVWFGH